MRTLTRNIYFSRGSVSSSWSERRAVLLRMSRAYVGIQHDSPDSSRDPRWVRPYRSRPVRRYTHVGCPIRRVGYRFRVRWRIPACDRKRDPSGLPSLVVKKGCVTDIRSAHERSDLLSASAARRPERAEWIYGGEQASYADVADRVARLARGLRCSGRSCREDPMAGCHSRSGRCSWKRRCDRLPWRCSCRTR